MEIEPTWPPCPARQTTYLQTSATLRVLGVCISGEPAVPRGLRPISGRCKAVNDPKFVALQNRRSTPVVSAAASWQRFAELALSPTA